MPVSTYCEVKRLQFRYLAIKTNLLDYTENVELIKLFKIKYSFNLFNLNRTCLITMREREYMYKKITTNKKCYMNIYNKE